MGRCTSKYKVEVVNKARDLKYITMTIVNDIL
jgi:hypothetical protein